MAWDRYAYVFCNPIRYIDPMGHAVACEKGDTCKHFSKPDPSLAVFEDYSGKWENYPELQGIIENKLLSLGGRLASVINKEQSILYKMGELIGRPKRYSTTEAFLLVFGSPVKFLMMANMATYAAERNYQGGINIYLPTWIKNHSNIVYHEIGHHFENLFGIKSLALPDSFVREANSYGNAPEYNGFFDVVAMQHPSSDPGEQWADLFANLMSDNIANDDYGYSVWTWTLANFR